MMIIENKYNIGDMVYLKTDNEQSERMITAIQINPGNLLYRLNCGTTETWHYEFEINKEKDIIKSLTDETKAE